MTPHQKIMRAARRGTGLRLSAEDVFRLSRDGAIETCAENDDIADADVRRIIRNATRVRNTQCDDCRESAKRRTYCVVCRCFVCSHCFREHKLGNEQVTGGCVAHMEAKEKVKS